MEFENLEMMNDILKYEKNVSIFFFNVSCFFKAWLNISILGFMPLVAPKKLCHLKIPPSIPIHLHKLIKLLAVFLWINHVRVKYAKLSFLSTYPRHFKLSVSYCVFSFRIFSIVSPIFRPRCSQHRSLVRHTWSLVNVFAAIVQHHFHKRALIWHGSWWLFLCSKSFVS